MRVRVVRCLVFITRYATAFPIASKRESASTGKNMEEADISDRVIGRGDLKMLGESMRNVQCRLGLSRISTQLTLVCPLIRLDMQLK